MIKLPVLEKDDTWYIHKTKLLEEVKEVIEELSKNPHSEKEKTKVNLLAALEVFDLVQVSIGILKRLEEEGIDIEKVSKQHMDKLVSRGWKFVDVIEIQSVLNKTEV